MKIGVLTHKYSGNFGGILQCYALQETLKKMGHEVSVINFAVSQNSFKEKVSIFLKGGYSMSFVFSRILIYVNRGICKKYELKNRKAKEFLDTNVNLTELVHIESISSLVCRFDAIIVGSDRVWGALGNRILPYFFDWEPFYQGLRISYAACTPNDSIPYYNRNKIKKLLLKFDHLSVRDSHTMDMVKRYTGRTPELVLDPTFIYDFPIYGEHRENGEPYIFVYVLGLSIKGGHHAAINEIKEKTGLRWVKSIVVTKESLDVKKFSDEILFDVSPVEWITLLQKASFVYTDSFHASIFAIKYHRPFITYYSEHHRATRLLDLKERFHLDNHFVCHINEIDVSKIYSFNYETLDLLLDVEKKKSLDFIRRALLDNLTSN